MCNKSNPCVAPLPSSNGVENNASLRYNYIADESSPSSDPYGIGVEEGNNMLPLPINVSSDIPLLTRPKKRFKNNNNNNIVHKPFSSSGYGFSMVTNILEPHSREVAAATMEPDNTSNVNVAITVAPPPPVPENEEEVELEDLPLPFPYPEAEQGANGIPFETSTILVKRNKNIIRKLVKFAQKQGFFILGANGTVSLVELLNDEDAPVAKTTLQIVVAPLSAIDAESMARQQYLRRPELVHFPNYRHRDWLTKEVVNRIHKATLKELNNEITNTLA
ncbi:hypothetical protein TanjilG_25444 [Lupinus angustifolius]|uniref:Uncharacterized protein n=1 Tax=Lupinus angustifolius TaxID=3871 RepID=A0A4P1QT07_LUPAN|nr:hypothetical protein TanjilG_25444 [Lupinus angustifolius]